MQARYLGDLVDDGIANTPSRPCTVQTGQNMGVGGGGGLQCRRGILVILWMLLRVGIVPCVSKIDTLGLFLSLLKADEKLRVSLVNGPN